MADDSLYDNAATPFEGEPRESESSASSAGPAVPNPAPPDPTAAADPAGFCQDCGRPLSRATVRPVGSSIFCEPCLARRIGAPPVGGASAHAGATQTAGGWQPVSGAAVPPSAPVAPLSADDPSPGLAGLLGLIPGVGAMYNGQFGKGVVHLAIFAAFVWLANNVSGIFGMFVAGWIFYQAFEAYHTAKARRDGLPLPDPFGLNSVGDRLGMHFNTRPGTPSSAGPAYPAPAPPPGSYAAPSVGTRPVSAPGAPVVIATGDYASGYVPGAPAYGPVDPAFRQPYVPPAPPPSPYASVGASWLGYVSPESIPRVPVTPQPVVAYSEPGPGLAGQAAPPVSDTGSPGEPPPYRSTYTGSQPTNVMFDEPSSHSLPAAAFWLIGLGVVVLLFNVIPGWRLSASWLSTAVLAGVAVWALLRQITSWNAQAEAGLPPRSPAERLRCLRFAMLLFTLAILMAIQAAGLFTLGQTWPVLLVVFGGCLLAERILPGPEAIARRAAEDRP